jgi:uncharacterized circularly permuted ATP-grasp superfamily protein/uncharacterized alpha-E superfamily protein
MLAEDGQIRPAGDILAGFLDGLSGTTLRQRADQVRQLVRDHGVSYNVPGDKRSRERAWQLDAIPWPISPGDFADLEAGLAQRARLLDRILADLYGPQKLLRQGFLPMQMVLGNPTFLRPCHGMRLPNHLHFYAADVARTRQGAFRVLRDRTQAPTGLGYALENRLVISQVFEEAFRESNVQRLAMFFRGLRESLEALAPATRESPRIVILSSGTFSPTHFEQAFLAQYLGYPLVEGGDLTVRDRRVFLKTLGGLFPIDVVFRQPADDYCDPLELLADSHLGVPGLVEAVRAGQVAVANALGAGLTQSPAFLPFLPRIARDFFGEALKLDTQPAYWCGEPAALAHVESHLADMVVRPAWSGAGNGAGLVDGEYLDGEQHAAFLARLRARPWEFVAQEKVALSEVPALVGNTWESRPGVLRIFATLTNHNYAVMPGGLALVGNGESDDISVAGGGLAKDLWVRSDQPVTNFSLLPPSTRPVELSREGADLPSRSADNLFWLGRYTERAEALARLTRNLLRRLAEEGDLRLDSSPALPTLFDVLATATECAPLGSTHPSAWLVRALWSSATPGSLHNTLRAALRSAASVRDRLSADTFRVLGVLDDEATRASSFVDNYSLNALAAYLDRVVTSLSALSGLAMESMTRGHGWRFLDMGRRLERALQLLSLLRSAFAAGAEREGALLETLLAVADSSITYRRRYLAGLHPAAVMDLLLVDDSNPRAVLFQLVALHDHLHQLPHDHSQARLLPEERLALGALARLQLLDVAPACQPQEEGKPPHILSVLVEIENDLSHLSEHLCGGYLNHALMARPLAEAAPPRGLP